LTDTFSAANREQTELSRGKTIDDFCTESYNSCLSNSNSWD